MPPSWRLIGKKKKIKKIDLSVVKRVEGLLREAPETGDVKQEILSIARGEADDIINFLDKGLTPAGAAALAEALACASHIRRLDLSGNHLGPDGVRKLADGLQHVPNLQVLCLSENSIGSEGAWALVDGLRHLQELQALFLQGNTLEAEGIRLVTHYAKYQSNLRVLAFGKLLLKDDMVEQVKRAMRELSSLSSLHLFADSIGRAAARTLGVEFSRNAHVEVSFQEQEEREIFEASRRTVSVHSLTSHVDHSGCEADTASTGSIDIARLQQQLAEQAKKQRQSQTLVQDLFGQTESLRAEVTAKDERSEELARQLKEESSALAASKAANQEQAEQLKIQQQTITKLESKTRAQEERIRELEKELQLQGGDNLQQRAEAALNLNIPPARFNNKLGAKDSKGNPITGGTSSLYTATFAGHCVALKEVQHVEGRPRLSKLLACRDGSNNAGDTTAVAEPTAATATATSTTEYNERLHREAHVLLTIRHPNIVSFLGLSHDEHHHKLFFVLSWADGGSLFDHLHKHQRELLKEQRARIAMELAGAMQFLHAHGIVHRDLKSPNVLLDSSLSAKVTDFGLSAFKTSDTETLTLQKGTPLWASPEQLLDEKLYADTDVFSFGVLYWELCFNCKPWHHGKYKGKGASWIDIANSYKAGQYLPLDEEISGVALSVTESLLLGGCFDVSGKRVDFTQLHTALKRSYNSTKQHQKLSRKQRDLEERKQREMLFGAEDAVWKFQPSLFQAVKTVMKQLKSRPSVSIAPLDLKRDAAVITKLLTEAGGLTAAQPNPLKPFNHTLAAVAITHDKQKEAAFNGALAKNRVRYLGHLTSGSSHPFSPRYKHSTSTKEPTNEEHKQVLRRVTCGTAYKLLDPSLLQEDPPLRLQRVFHGVTSWGAVVGILGGDFASLRQVDSGFYGTGIYFTPDLDYALKYSHVYWKKGEMAAKVPPELKHLQLDASKEYRVVLACDVQYGNPFPVLDAVQFKGKPLAPAHDAHVVVVKAPKKATLGDAVPFKSHTQWKQQGGRRPLAEIVVDETSSILVRAVLVFQAPGGDAAALGDVSV